MMFCLQRINKQVSVLSCDRIRYLLNPLPKTLYTLRSHQRVTARHCLKLQKPIQTNH